MRRFMSVKKSVLYDFTRIKSKNNKMRVMKQMYTDHSAYMSIYLDFVTVLSTLMVNKLLFNKSVLGTLFKT